MASNIAKQLMFFVVITIVISGCMSGYGYGLRPGTYGAGYSYRAPVYRSAPSGGGGGGGSWGYRGGGGGGGFHGGGCRH